MPDSLVSERGREQRRKGLTLWVFIFVQMNDFNWHAANTGVLSDLLSERRASEASKEKSYGSFRETHGVIEAKDDNLLSLPWPETSSQYVFLYFSITIAEDVIAGSAGPSSTSNIGRRKNRVGSGAWGRDVDEIVRGWSEVSALLLGY